LVGGAIGTIKDDTETFEGRAGDNSAAQETQILVMKRIVRFEIGYVGRRPFRAVLQDAGFNFLFNGVGELHAFVGEEFDAVILIRIVGCRDHHAGVKIVVADQASDAGSGKDSGERDGGAPLL